MAGRARLSYRTAGDCLSHLIPAATFRQLLADSPPVAAWFNEGLATKGRLSSGSGRGEAAELMVIRVGEADLARSEEHTSELQSLMRISSAVLCLTKNTITHKNY